MEVFCAVDVACVDELGGWGSSVTIILVSYPIYQKIPSNQRRTPFNLRSRSELARGTYGGMCRELGVCSW